MVPLLILMVPLLILMVPILIPMIPLLIPIIPLLILRVLLPIPTRPLPPAVDIPDGQVHPRGLRGGPVPVVLQVELVPGAGPGEQLAQPPERAAPDRGPGEAGEVPVGRGGAFENGDPGADVDEEVGPGGGRGG